MSVLNVISALKTEGIEAETAGVSGAGVCWTTALAVGADPSSGKAMNVDGSTNSKIQTCLCMDKWIDEIKMLCATHCQVIGFSMMHASTLSSPY